MKSIVKKNSRVIKRKSPLVKKHSSLKRKSPKHSSLKRKSPKHSVKRKSHKHSSVKRKSPKHSLKRKSHKHSSLKRKSPKQKSPKRSLVRSPKDRSARRSLYDVKSHDRVTKKTKVRSYRRSKSKSPVKSHYRVLEKTRVKTHYRMKGMGNLLTMYGGAAAELEEAHKQCLNEYKDMINKYNDEVKTINDLKAQNSSKSTINDAIKTANDIRNKIVELVDAVDGCKAKQKALLDSIHQVATDASEHLDKQIQTGAGRAAEWGAKLDNFGDKSKVYAKQVGQKLSSGMKSAAKNLSVGAVAAGNYLQDKYGNLKDTINMHKRLSDLSYCEKNFTKDELASGTMSVT